MTSETDPYGDWDGAYVLGALSAADRREYEQHLATCERCTRDVGELAGMPGVLGLVPADEALSISEELATATLGDDVPQPAPQAPPVSLLARRAWKERSRRRVLLAAAAVVLLVAGGVGGALLPQVVDREPAVVVAAPQTPRSVRLAPVDASGVQADLTLEPTAWGTRLEWSCSYPPDYAVDGVEYDLTVVDRSGERVRVATWNGGASSITTGLTASTSLTPAEIGSIEMSATTLSTPLAAATL